MFVGAIRGNMDFSNQTSQQTSTKLCLARGMPPIMVIALPRYFGQSASHPNECRGVDKTVDYLVLPFGSTLSFSLSLTCDFFTIANGCSRCLIRCLAARNWAFSMDI